MRPFTEWMERVNLILERHGTTAAELDECEYWQQAWEDGLTPMTAVRDAGR